MVATAPTAKIADRQGDQPKAYAGVEHGAPR